jgi:hypothetical protein
MSAFMNLFIFRKSALIPVLLSRVKVSFCFLNKFPKRLLLFPERLHTSTIEFCYCEMNDSIEFDVIRGFYSCSADAVFLNRFFLSNTLGYEPFYRRSK